MANLVVTVRRWREDAATVMALAAVGIIAFALGIFANDQPVHWHPDEASKVRQIVGGHWNFNHPHLLLNAARLVHLVQPERAGGESTYWAEVQLEIARSGRTASAGLAAFAAVALGTMIWLLFDRWSGLLAALLVGLSPPLVLRAHYFKEDTALVMGLSVLGLGAALMNRRPGLASAAFLGVGAGLATSGKYAGAVPACAALIMLLTPTAQTSWSRRWYRVLVAAFSGVVVVFLVNFEVVGAWQNLLFGFDRAYDHARVTGHSSLRPVPFGAFYWTTLWMEVPAAITIMALVGLWGAVAIRPRRIFGPWTTAAFPFAYLTLLALSKIAFGRYLLPVMVAMSVLAAVGVRTCAQWAGSQHRRHKLVVATLLATLVITASAIRTGSYLQSMTRDSRLRLASWVMTELPPTRLIQDRYAALDVRQMAMAGHYLRTERSVLARWSLDDLRRHGITHLVAAWPEGFRYQMAGITAMPGREAEIARVRDRYAQLKQEGVVVWQSDPPPPVPGYSNPLIRVYDIRFRD